MKINATEITNIIEDRIKDLDVDKQARSVGKITSVRDGIVTIHGLTDVVNGELLEFESGDTGMALNLEQDSVAAAILGTGATLSEGQEVRCTGRVFDVPVGEGLIGEWSMRWVILWMAKVKLRHKSVCQLKRLLQA